MTISLSVPRADTDLRPRITVIGVGGAGGNAVNNMISAKLEGVDFVAANTDAQALAMNHADAKLQLGIGITHGLGAGSRPEIGRAAAEEALEEIIRHVQNAHMVFIAAGMGGGTGTGAAPVIARVAREHGVLTVGVVTKPFQFEGMNRMRLAEAGIAEMQQYVDTLIVIPNQNLFRIANEKTTFAQAFAMADEVLYSGVRGITDLMVVPGLVNLDFADIRTVMSEMGKAMMGTGEAEGDNRAKRAAESAISNPLLDDVSMKGARGVLINITGGPDMTLFEVDEAANRIGDEVDPNANIIFGSTTDPALAGRVRVTVVATGIDAAAQQQPRPVIRLVQDGRQTLVPTQRRERPAEPAETLAPARAQELPAAMTAASAAPPPSPAATSPATAQPSAAEPSRPARPPRPAATQEGFLPPLPADPRSAEPKLGERPAAPPATRAPESAADDRDRRRGPSLFQRMTGAARTRKDQDSAPTASVTTSATPTRATPALAVTRPSAPATAPEQPRLQGVDAKDRISTSHNEEDLLDIPAFLRRQAN